VCKKIKFVGVVVFEKKRFEAIVDGNVYLRPRHKDRRRNSSVLKSDYWPLLSTYMHKGKFVNAFFIFSSYILISFVIHLV
jgi:hypothetical protein